MTNSGNVLLKSSLGPDVDSDGMQAGMPAGKLNKVLPEATLSALQDILAAAAFKKHSAELNPTASLQPCILIERHAALLHLSSTS